MLGVGTAYDELIDINKVKLVFAGLKKAIDTLGLSSARISSVGNDLEPLPWQTDENLLVEAVGDSICNIMVCSNETLYPDE